MTEKPMVLVTGASGYIAMHCIAQLLDQGYRVRGTLRTPSRAADLRRTFARHVAVEDRLEFVTTDLMRDDGWAEAVAGCAYVMHVASPFPSEIPRHEDDLIIPAREGTRRVLQAAADAQVKRVVLTSSAAAVQNEYNPEPGHLFDENDWPDVSQTTTPYAKSKTLAERAAWEFVENHPALELAVINPVVVLGPLLDKHYSTSTEIVIKLMRQDFPGCPNLGWSLVDVRDVAAAHLAAMTIPEAAGQRFVCAHEFAWMQDIARILHDHFAYRGYNIPQRKLPNIMIRFLALFDKTTRMVINDLGVRVEYSNARITSVLNWQPRSLQDMVIATGKSLIEHGVVRSPR